MLLNIVYSGGINIITDSVVTRYVERLGGKSLSAGCMMIGDMHRDLQFRLPDECRERSAEITGHIKFLVARIVSVGMGDENAW